MDFSNLLNKGCMKRSFEDFVLSIVKKSNELKLDLKVMEENIKRLQSNNMKST